MQFIKTMVKRSLMTCLFLAALLTTIVKFSGVEATGIVQWANEKEFSINTHIKKTSDLMFKSLSHIQKSPSMLATNTIALPKGLNERIATKKHSKYTVVATGYTAGIESTGKLESHPAYGITKSGVKVRRDLYSTIAADTSVFPIGSILFIPGYGYGVVADTGSTIKDKKIDLYYKTVDDVYEQWGKRTVVVYLIEEGNGKLTEQELTSLNEQESMQVFREQLFPPQGS